ncbi:MAG: hypothetical protein R2824_18030 [Saprospiraceae bacterium]
MSSRHLNPFFLLFRLRRRLSGEVSIDFTIDENCTPEDLTITIYLDAYRMAYWTVTSRTC